MALISSRLWLVVQLFLDFKWESERASGSTMPSYSTSAGSWYFFFFEDAVNDEKTMEQFSQGPVSYKLSQQFVVFLKEKKKKKIGSPLMFGSSLSGVRLDGLAGVID